MDLEEGWSEVGGNERLSEKKGWSKLGGTDAHWGWLELKLRKSAGEKGEVKNGVDCVTELEDWKDDWSTEGGTGWGVDGVTGGGWDDLGLEVGVSNY